MSEIKILKWRGVWNVREGVIIHGFLVDDHTIRDIETGSDYSIIPASLAMSTGLFDKYGAEIFGSMPGTRGGDVISDPYKVCSGEVVTGEVVYNAEEGGFQVNVLYEDGSVMPERLYELNSYMLIIGNAFLDPELLEV